MTQIQILWETWVTAEGATARKEAVGAFSGEEDMHKEEEGTFSEFKRVALLPFCMALSGDQHGPHSHRQW